MRIEKTPMYQRPHICSVCHKEFTWSKESRWWGSLLEEDLGEPVIKICSGSCKVKYEDSRKAPWLRELHKTTKRAGEVGMSEEVIGYEPHPENGWQIIILYPKGRKGLMMTAFHPSERDKVCVALNAQHSPQLPTKPS